VASGFGGAFSQSEDFPDRLLYPEEVFYVGGEKSSRVLSELPWEAEKIGNEGEIPFGAKFFSLLRKSFTETFYFSLNFFPVFHKTGNFFCQLLNDQFLKKICFDLVKRGSPFDLRETLRENLVDLRENLIDSFPFFPEIASLTVKSMLENAAIETDPGP